MIKVTPMLVENLGSNAAECKVTKVGGKLVLRRVVFWCRVGFWRIASPFFVWSTDRRGVSRALACGLPLVIFALIRGALLYRNRLPPPPLSSVSVGYVPYKGVLFVA